VLVDERFEQVGPAEKKQRIPIKEGDHNEALHSFDISVPTEFDHRLLWGDQEERRLNGKHARC
jgi:hypothetical protein